VGKDRRNFVGSLVTFSAQFGVLIAASSYHLAMSKPEMPELWRVSFIAGGVFGIILFTLRGFLEESRQFLEAKRKPDIFDDMRLYEIVTHHKLKFTLATVINGFLGGVYHFLIIFLATFVSNVTHLISASEAQAINIKLVAIYGFAGVAAGLVADRVNYFVQTITALAVALMLAIALQYSASNNIYVMQLHKAIACVVPFFMLPSYARVQTLFASNIRMRMCSLSHSVGSLLFSSTTPVVCMIVWKYTNNYSLVITCFIVQIVILLLTVLVMLKQNYKNELDAHLQS
jgi:MFS transporter, MHS family, proline/betaine transporter